MNQTQQWPLATAPSGASSTRLKILLCAFCSTVVLASYLVWMGAGKAALAQTTSLSSNVWPGDLPIKVPAAASAGVVSGTNENREAEFLAYMGDQMFQRGDVQGAADAYKKALEHCPTSEKIHVKLAVCLARLHRTNEAMEALQEAIHIAPDFPQAHHEMGLLLLRSSQFSDAAEHFAEVTRLKPSQASAFNALGLALARQGQFNAASNSFARAIQLDGRYVEARFNLAQIYLQHGAKAEAAQELDRALQVNPQFSPARSLRDQLGCSAPQNLQARR